jgi:hypothetical protein
MVPGLDNCEGTPPGGGFLYRVEKIMLLTRKGLRRIQFACVSRVEMQSVGDGVTRKPLPRGVAFCCD